MIKLQALTILLTSITLQASSAPLEMHQNSLPTHRSLLPEVYKKLSIQIPSDNEPFIKTPRVSRVTSVSELKILIDQELQTFPGGMINSFEQLSVIENLILNASHVLDHAAKQSIRTQIVCSSCTTPFLYKLQASIAASHSRKNNTRSSIIAHKKFTFQQALMEHIVPYHKDQSPDSQKEIATMLLAAPIDPQPSLGYADDSSQTTPTTPLLTLPRLTTGLS